MNILILNRRVITFIFIFLVVKLGAQNTILIEAGSLVNTNGTSLIINGNLINKANTNNAIANSGTIQLSGDFTNNATSGNLLSGSTGEVVLKGSSTQTIKGTASTYFTKLKVDNSTGVTIDIKTFVETKLTFTSGIINTSAGKEISFTADAATYSGESNTAHINGPMKRTGQSNFIYPVGNGTHIAQLAVEDLASSNTFTVEYNASTPVNNTNFSGENITVVSSVEYWNVTPSSGSPSSNLRLYFHDAAFSGIGDPSLLLGAHYDGSSTWNEVAYISNTTNSFKFGPVTSYSNFTFGSSDNVTNPLPVELLFFNADALQTSIELSWATASELNAEVFELQRSTNTIDFETITTIKAAGNSNTIINYNFNDIDIESNKDYYYRLKQIDFDGKFEYSNIRIAKLEGNQEITINVFPNPSQNHITIKSNIEDNVSLELFNINGKRILYKENMKVTNLTLNLESLPSDVYILRIHSSDKVYKAIRITKL